MCFRQFTKKSVAIHGERIVSWWHFFLSLSLKPPQNYKLRICTHFFTARYKIHNKYITCEATEKSAVNQLNIIHALSRSMQSNANECTCFDSWLITWWNSVIFSPQQPVYWVYPIRKIMRNQVHSPNWWRTCHHVPLICYVSTCLSSHHTYSFFIHSFTSRPVYCFRHLAAFSEHFIPRLWWQNKQKIES